MKKTIEDRFKQAMTLRKQNQLKEAVNELLTIIEDFPGDTKIGKIYMVLGGIYYKLNDIKKSFVYSKAATELNPKSELASLNLYLSYVRLAEHEKAIDELQRFLDQYPADLYKDTLEELLLDLKNGYALKFKETILRLAKKNNIHLV
jgi:tetratricopeptide (TPR) repeat protein